jgi:hypothetical protein
MLKKFILEYLLSLNLQFAKTMNNTPIHLLADPAQRAYRIAYLICEYIKGTLDHNEISELENWLQATTENQSLFAELTDPANIRREIQPRMN